MRHLGWLVAAVVMSACASKGNLEPPAELVDFDEALAVERVWSLRVGGDPLSRLALAPATDGEDVYVAGQGGVVIRAALEDGRRAWRQELDARLSAGPGIGGGLAVVATSDGRVIALEQETGAVRWRSRVSSEVLAAPVVAGQIVVVRTADERVFGLDAVDGGELWRHEQSIPSLVLRGTAGIAVGGDVAITGYANGKVNALQARNGQVEWETTVGSPEGRTEVERMVDVNSTPRIIGRDVYAVSFQGRLVALARDSGSVLWSHEASSSAGLGADGGAVYVTDEESEVRAYDRLTGGLDWHQAALRMRALSAPVVVGDAVAVGDFDGFVHFLARDSGDLVARVRAGPDPVQSPPVVFADRLLVQGAGGVLTVFKVGDD